MSSGKVVIFSNSLTHCTNIAKENPDNFTFNSFADISVSNLIIIHCKTVKLSNYQRDIVKHAYDCNKKVAISYDRQYDNSIQFYKVDYDYDDYSANVIFENNITPIIKAFFKKLKPKIKDMKEELKTNVGNKTVKVSVKKPKNNRRRLLLLLT